MQVAMVLALLGLLAASPAAQLASARAALREGRAVEAANALFALPEGPERDLALAEALGQLGFRYGAFFHAAQLVRQGPDADGFAEALSLASRAATDLRDEVVAPTLFHGLPVSALAQLSPEARAELAGAQALFEYRAGRPALALQLLDSAPASGLAGERARVLRGLVLAQREPARALELFRAAAASPAASPELRDLAHLDAARMLFAQQQYRDAADEDERIGRFSRHWDEALFEGAWASFRAGDGGAALGKLHALHSPHLWDRFAPESGTLAALVYHEHCLHPQAREALERAERVYGPMQAQLARVLEAQTPLSDYLGMLEPGDPRLPVPVQRHLAKNERVEAFRTHLARLEAESERVRSNPALSPALSADLLDLLGREQALVAEAGGRFVRGRLDDLQRLLQLLQGEAGIVRFETAKAEKQMLEQRIDARPRLAAQTLERPAMPPTGHEYWPFDGEYWPDEIGYYRYTLKDACAREGEAP